MSTKNVAIDLQPRQDKDGRTFYVGKIKAPVLIDCSEGAVFLVFVSEQGQESLQIGLMNGRDNDD
jgi:hypothetical protein